jgi:hypothetical protein
MRVTLVGTGLRPPVTGASGCFRNLSTAMLAAFASQQERVAARWEITQRSVPFAIDQERFDEATIRSVVQSAPDVLALGCYCWDLQAQIDLGERVKAERPETRVWVGGPEASHRGAALLERHASLDVVVQGEGEERFAQLLATYPAEPVGIPRIAWRGADGRVVQSGGRERALELDALPSPHLVFPKPEPAAELLEFSRGCRFRCKYCSWPRDRAPLRLAPFERMRDEIAQVGRASQSALVIDSAVNDTAEHLSRLIAAVAEGDPAGRIDLSMFVDPRLVTPGSLPREPGRRFRLEIGINSTNPNVSGLVGRPSLAEDALLEKIELCGEVGLVNLHLILGLPGDDLAGFRRSLDFAGRAVDRIGRHRVGGVRVFWLVVTPGSELWEQREPLGIRVREHGVPYALATSGFDAPDRAEALRALQTHAVAPWCVVDGPSEVLADHVLPGFEQVVGHLVPKDPPPAVTGGWPGRT